MNNNEFFVNDICNFNCLNKQFEYSNDDIIISTCLFKMNEHYKNFYIYINGLKRWQEYLNKLNNNKIKYLIFIDQNIKDDDKIMYIINKSKMIPILFDCPNYKNNNFHYDLFGSLVRFFPIFDPKNKNKVIVVDIDLHQEDYKKIDFFIEHINLLDGLGGFANYDGINLPYIFAGMFMCSEKFDTSMLFDFIKNPPDMADTGFYKKRKTTFGFGIDEIFINKYMIPATKTFFSCIDYKPTNFMFYAKKNMFTKTPRKSKTCLKYILGKYYVDGMKLDDMYNAFDKELYNTTSYSEKAIYMGKRYYNVIKYLVKNNKQLINKNLEKISYDNLLDVFSCILYIKFDKNKKESLIHTFKSIKL